MPKQLQNLKMLVCSPHNYSGIVGGREENFEVLSLFEHNYCEKKFSKRKAFLQHHLQESCILPNYTTKLLCTADNTGEISEPDNFLDIHVI